MSKELLENRKKSLWDIAEGLASYSGVELSDKEKEVVSYFIEQSERAQGLERNVKLLEGQKGIHAALNDKAVEIIEEKEKQNKRYREAINDIKTTWKKADNIYNHVEMIHEIIKSLEGDE